MVPGMPAASILVPTKGPNKSCGPGCPKHQIRWGEIQCWSEIAFSVLSGSWHFRILVGPDQ